MSGVPKEKVALITGITGQDGSYLAEFLLGKGYTVHGLIRRASTFNTSRIDHIYEDPHLENRRLILHHGDLTDGSMLARMLAAIRPTEIYNLGAQSHVGVSFDMPEHTADATALGLLRLLEAIRDVRIAPRIYQASSSEMFGDASPPQCELTDLRPNSPYAAAKVYAHHIAGLYREAYGLFVARGILFNHESPRRGETFVTRKITRAVARIVAGKERNLYLGDLDARRDWGYAPEYVEAMWLMMTAETPSDFVIATGETHSVAEFCEMTFSLVGLDWRRHVAQDPRYLRPKEVPALRGDTSKAQAELGWKPQIGAAQLAQIMLQCDLAREGVHPTEVIRTGLLPECPVWARLP